MSSIIVWFRNDLRLADHPALHAAAKLKRPVVPVYLRPEPDSGDWQEGGASRWWLHHSLSALDEKLVQCGSRLIIATEPSPVVALERLVQATGATAIYWNRRYEPSAIACDTLVKEHFRRQGLEVKSFPGNLLQEPWQVQTAQGNPYQVFTPFWKACQAQLRVDPPLPAPGNLSVPDEWPPSPTIDSLKLLPTRNWASQFADCWQPGETGAGLMLARFLKSAVLNYREGRNVPADHGTSRLSPHLHFGEVTPRQVWTALARSDFANTEGAHTFRAELGWREFAHHILYHFPQTPTAPLRTKFSHFPWEQRKSQLRAWQRGETGYPIVDAGMRELWATGWMHNRVRMIVGSFLTKHLLVSWQAGAAWFWDTLVDADLANNTLGWQWISGCGADAAPYFRIFNPVLQGEKFDPAGAYVRRWVPELSQLQNQFIHQPWKASPAELKRAGLKLGKDYPHPLVDHITARQQALAALKSVSGVE